MEEIKFVDTEGRNIWLLKPLMEWAGYQVRIGDECVATVKLNKQTGQWEAGYTSVYDDIDLPVIVDMIVEYERQKGRWPLK